MFLKVGIIVAAPFLLVSAVLGVTGVVLVDVQEADGFHIAIPVPLLLAQTALRFAPEEARYIDMPEAEPYLPIARKVMQELKDAPDFTLVEVNERDEHVLVRKVGDDLLVEVEERGNEMVSCRIPIKGVDKVLRSYDGRGFHTKSALAALRSASRGDIVHVVDGEDRVRIRKLF
jgi:hypothetical protein